MRLFFVLAAGALLLAGGAQAGDPGMRRAGLWQVTIIGPDGKPRPPRTYCYAARSIADSAKSFGTCSRNDVSKLGDTTTIDASCTNGAHQMSLHMTLTAMGETAYHAKMHATYSPPIAGMGAMDMVSDSKWLGPCPPGEKPVH